MRQYSGVTWVEISRKALLHNVSATVNQVQSNGMNIIPVIKSNAYGHGIVQIAKLLQDSGLVDRVAVVNLEEALLLRESGISLGIMVLTYADWWTEQGRTLLREGISKDIEFPVYSDKYFATLEKEAQSLGKRGILHLKVDTGTSRIGPRTKDEILSLAKKISKSKHVELKSFWTHLACAEEVENSFNYQQIEVFKGFISDLEESGITCSEYHTSATAALMSRSDDTVNVGRLGIGLYGLWPSESFRKWLKKQLPEFDLQPVLTWKTRILQVKDVEKNSCIGYDCTYTTHRKTRIAVLPVGYFEGYDRLYSNKAFVLIRGQRAKVLGTVCMNMTMVDVTGIDGVTSGDEVVLLGKQGSEEISADQLATISQTINYEVVTRINAALPRIIVE